MNTTKRKIVSVLVVMLCTLGCVRTNAQQNTDHLNLSAGALYERGLDVTIAYEHTTKYHNAWEYFAMGYVKYEEDKSAGHYTKDSFWKSYRSWHLGICYKPCVSRGRNHHGNFRIGATGGSNTNRFVGGVHVGYEHSYALNSGWELFFLAKEDVAIRGKDLFRTGVEIGVKVPLNN